jgi:hypothetical protein
MPAKVYTQEETDTRFAAVESLVMQHEAWLVNHNGAIAGHELRLSALEAEPTPPPPPPPPTTGTLIRAANMQFLGAFKLPGDDQAPAATYNYGGHALAYNAANNSLFVAGHDWEQRVGEVKVPALKSGTYDQLDVAIQLQSPAAVKARLPTNLLYDLKLGGLLWTGNKLIGSAYEFYDANGATQVSHFTLSGALATGQVTGLHRVGTLGGGYVGGYMGTIPSEWQARLGGKYLTGLTGINIVSRGSWGQSAFVFDPDKLGVTDPLPVIPLVYYTQANPLAIYDAPSPWWNVLSRTRGIVFPEGTDSVLFFGSHGNGDPVYGGGGYSAPPYVYKCWAFDAKELEKVKAGTKQPWEPRPYDHWELSGFVGTVDTSFGLFCGACWDSVNRRVFVAFRGPNGATVINVWKIQ